MLLRKWSRAGSVLVLALGMFGCAQSPTRISAPSAQPGKTRVEGAFAARGSNPRYVVTLKGTSAEVDPSADDLESKHGFKSIRRFHQAVRGFVSELTPAQVERLRGDARVISVQPERRVALVTTQSNPPSWGLDRVDQRALPLNSAYVYGRTGAGVDVYVIDTGIHATHQDFGGRVLAGVDETGSGNTDDVLGHGTHVAGTIGGSAYGVARGVHLIPIRVFDANGLSFDWEVIGGVDWMVTNHVSNPAVANFSIRLEDINRHGMHSDALDTAVRNAIADGITCCIAAGNDTPPVDVGITSPADVVEAITVGATDITDAKASFSDYGSVVDLHAPGVNIVSDWFTSNAAANPQSGTSAAAPHVSGCAALYLEGNPAATPATVAAALTSGATQNAISGLPVGTPNRLLYTLLPRVSVGNSGVLDFFGQPSAFALPIGLTPSNIVKTDIAGSNDHVYAWYTNGTASSGTSDNLSAYIAPFPYTLPPGYVIGDIAGIAIASSNDHVYVWYRNGNVSSGTSGKFDQFAAPSAFTLPPGYTTSDIVDMAINPQDRVYTWYKNGKVSVGNSGKLDFFGAPTTYTPAAGYVANNILGIGIARSTSKVYSWYSF